MSDKVVRTLTGTVVADAKDKTVRVRVERRVQHKLYGKVMRRHTHFLAHDESSGRKKGDVVTIRECPRMSKRKSWLVVDTAAGDGR